MTDQRKPARRHYCFNCGEDMGIWDSRYCEATDPCGKPECVQEAQYAAQAEREEAHEQLDRDMGW